MDKETLWPCMSVGTMETCNTVQTWSQPMRIMKEHLISCAVLPGNAYPHEHLLEAKPFSLPDGQSAMALTPAQPVDPLCRDGLYRGQHVHERVFLSQGGPKMGRSTVQCVCFFEAAWLRLQRAPENAIKLLSWDCARKMEFPLPPLHKQTTNDNPLW